MHVYCMNDFDGSPGQASVSSFDTALGRASGDGTKGLGIQQDYGRLMIVVITIWLFNIARW